MPSARLRIWLGRVQEEVDIMMSENNRGVSKAL